MDEYDRLPIQSMNHRSSSCANRGSDRPDLESKQLCESTSLRFKKLDEEVIADAGAQLDTDETVDAEVVSATSVVEVTFCFEFELGTTANLFGTEAAGVDGSVFLTEPELASEIKSDLQSELEIKSASKSGRACELKLRFKFTSELESANLFPVFDFKSHVAKESMTATRSSD